VLTNSTVATNTCGLPGTGSNANGAAGRGGGIVYSGGGASVQNTILANNANPNGGAYGVDCINFGTLNSQGYNLVEDGCSSDFTATGDLTAIDPFLSGLADNGGATWTHALYPSSPALDTGSCPGATADQRGFPRPVDLATIANVDDGCDIGAYEATTLYFVRLPLAMRQFP
jgi:hypothetical protein